MLDLQVTYDPNISIGGHMTNSTFDISECAVSLASGLIPRNFIEVSNQSTNFRDGVLHYLVDKVDDPRVQQTVLELLSAAVASQICTEEGIDSLRIYSEYAAPLALSWGETLLAGRIIVRNNSMRTSNFLKTTATAFDKKMETHMFKSLIVNSTASARMMWETVELPLLQP
jgi:hypothetical protein